MKRFKSYIVVALAVLVAVASIAPAMQASAAEPGASASLSIAPKKNYVIEPGKIVKDKLTIRNLDRLRSSLDLSLRVIDFYIY